ncbi:hypothetical protein ACFXDE_15045 [Kitasatospora sp. NPDC059408]|uniref:hypothetical protein n=1 Tax=Kitasatospora sp. NPDC059408 TaxID=3346823 RepID=UPI0036CDF9A7
MSAIALGAATASPRRSAVLRAAAIRHRTAVLTLVGVMAVLSVAMLLHGWYVHTGLHRLGADSCDPDTVACLATYKQFIHRYGMPLQTLDGVLYVLGGGFGAFAGGPLLAREFEHGTVRFAWTQGAGRSRWTVGAVTVVGGAVVVVAALFGVVQRWWSEPLVREAGQFNPDIFMQTWPVMAGRVLLTFGLALLAGAVLRRTVVAVGVGLAGSVALPFVAQVFRTHYRPPLEEAVHTMTPLSLDGRWVLDVWYSDPAGNRIGTGEFYDRGGDFAHLQAMVRDGGYTAHQVYQPADRFWPFQFIEAGWMLALGIAACAAAVWWVRRRAV